MGIGIASYIVVVSCDEYQERRKSREVFCNKTIKLLYLQEDRLARQWTVDVAEPNILIPKKYVLELLF